MSCSLSSIFTLRGKFRTPASRTAARQSTPPLCRTISRPTRRSWAARPTTLCKSINSFMFLWLKLAKLHLPPFKVILGGAKIASKFARRMHPIFQFSCLNKHFIFDLNNPCVIRVKITSYSLFRILFYK